MSAKPPFEIELHAAQNVMRTRYSGAVTALDMKAGAEDLQGMVAQLREGFTVFADLSGLDSMELECGPHLSRIMEVCKSHGVGRVIRVVPDRHKDIGMNILSLIHYRGRVPIITCDTLAEAEQALM